MLRKAALPNLPVAHIIYIVQNMRWQHPKRKHAGCCWRRAQQVRQNATTCVLFHCNGASPSCTPNGSTRNNEILKVVLRRRLTSHQRHSGVEAVVKRTTSPLLSGPYGYEDGSNDTFM
jgi:hypothetical protein